MAEAVNSAVATLAIMFIAGMVAMLILRAFWDTIKTRGKARLYMYDPDAVTFNLKWVKVEDAHAYIKEKVGMFRYKVHKIILPGEGRVGPDAWIIHPRHGWAQALAPATAQEKAGVQPRPTDAEREQFDLANRFTFFRGYTDKETVNADPLLLRLSVTNPEAYHLATARNRVAQALAANDQTDQNAWKLPAIIFGGLIVLALIIVLGVAFVKMGSK